MKVIAFAGDGEPLCNPYFRDLLEFCRSRRIRPIVCTNTTLIDEHWIKWLEESGTFRMHVSVDGAKKETYENLRVGADFDKVVYACKLFGKSKMQLILSCVLSSDEVVEELPAYIELAKSVNALGINFMKFQADSTTFGNPPNWNLHKGVLEKVKREAASRNLILAGALSNQPGFVECTDSYMCPSINLGGDVYACSYMANLRQSEVYLGQVIPVDCKSYCVGNVNKQNLGVIWKNDSCKELRAFLKGTRRPTGTQISPEDLLSMKLNLVGKFDYCKSCLCRWSEAGL